MTKQVKEEQEEPEATEDLDPPTAEAAPDKETMKAVNEPELSPEKLTLPRKFIYRGNADVVNVAGFAIRPGKVFTIHDDYVAEELLTLPYETFEEVKE